MLDNPNEPVSDLSYFDCIESVMENSKVGFWLKQTDTKHTAHFQLGILSVPFLLCRLSVQVLGESMAGISQNCKTGDVSAFGDCVGSASKALCGLTEAAGQVQSVRATTVTLPGQIKKQQSGWLWGMLFDECYFSTGFLLGGCVRP